MINQRGIDLVKKFEGLRLTAYNCPAGVLTIGYGSVWDAKPGMTITEEQADALLLRDLGEAEAAVKKLVKAPLTENQKAALVSFVFNLGAGRLKSSTLLKALNQGQHLKAADELLRWNKAGGKVLAGLTKRREAERELFLAAD